MKLRINIVQVGITGCFLSVAFAAYYTGWFAVWCASVALIGFGIGILLRAGD